MGYIFVDRVASRTYPFAFVSGVDEEEHEVDGLHDGAEAIDGGDKQAVRLGEAVVEP